MSTKVIPQRIETYCDACKKLCGTGGTTRKQMGQIIIRKHALDMLGDPAANGDWDGEFCDSCLYALCKAINNTAEKLAKAAGE